MTHTVLRGNAVMERKKVSISAKRQITIPQKFFTTLGFDDEAECILRGNELVIRPVKEAKNAADGNAEYSTYNDVFGTEE